MPIVTVGFRCAVWEYQQTTNWPSVWTGYFGIEEMLAIARAHVADDDSEH
jgi:hypothetical protein